MSTTAIPTLARQLADVVTTVIFEARPKLIEAALSGEHGESQNLRHAGNFLSVHDIWAHGRYLELLAPQVPAFVYASEEAEPQVVGPDQDPDLIIMVDPLDTSELAVRGLNGYTHVLAYSRSMARPIAAVVGDIFHHLRIYLAARDHNGQDVAFAIPADSGPIRLPAPVPKKLAEALITSYLMRPTERFMPLARQARLLRALGEPVTGEGRRGRIGVDFGSVGLCHVAAGMTDAMVEFAKGFAIWDLLPGHYILQAAGGSVLDLSGTPIPLDYGLYSLGDIATAMDQRRKFVAAGSVSLAHEILGQLDL